MGRVIVIEFMSLDGVMRDPDGRDGTAQGGWAFRYGPEAVSGDPFQLGELLDTGAMLLGRRTWELFAKIWPGRDDPFSAKMNAIPKLVATRTLDDAADWRNSTVLSGDLAAEVRERSRDRDILVLGSSSVVRTLAPLSAALVRIRPSTGPAHGAQRKPIATPSRRAPPMPERWSACCCNRAPNATNGRVNRSPSAGNTSVRPKIARRTSAAIRPT